MLFNGEGQVTQASGRPEKIMVPKISDKPKKNESPFSSNNINALRNLPKYSEG